MEEGRDGHLNGTFINGFHETWPIRHAEEAYGFARVGQTIVNVPDAKVDRASTSTTSRCVVSEAELLAYSRVLDFRDGVLVRELEWRTPAGKRVRVVSPADGVVHRPPPRGDRRTRSTLLDGDATMLISSQILNRQDGATSTRRRTAPPAFDPRKAEHVQRAGAAAALRRVGRAGAPHARLPATNSGMTIAVRRRAHAARPSASSSEPSHARGRPRRRTSTGSARRQGEPIRLTKVIGVPHRRGVPDARARRPLRPHASTAPARHGVADVRPSSGVARPTSGRDPTWRSTASPTIQQAVRWNLFQLAQAAARTDGGGIAAKGVTGLGLRAATTSGTPRSTSCRSSATPRRTWRATRCASGRGCSTPPAPGAPSSTSAAPCSRGARSTGRSRPPTTRPAPRSTTSTPTSRYALVQYVEATGDDDFLDARRDRHPRRDRPDVGGPRLLARPTATSTFHIHGVTGPDEYTTVVNDNLFTNVMARANLRAAAAVGRELRGTTTPRPTSGCVGAARARRRRDRRVGRGRRGDAHPVRRGARHPPAGRRSSSRRRCGTSRTRPTSKRPLLLHYHPLVIYRFQVLKQADVVLALFLQGDRVHASSRSAPTSSTTTR